MSLFSLQLSLTAAQHEVVQQIIELQRLLWPVLLNIVMTLFGWISVYDMKPDERISSSFLLDPNSNRTTGNALYDAMLNGVGSVICLGSVAFFMLFLALWNFRRLVQFWLQISCLLMLFVVSGGFIFDALIAFEVSEPLVPVLLGLFTALYGGLGSISFFTTHFPQRVHQFFVLCNCSLVSLFYLRTFPGHTAWFVLAGIALWDMFAVWSPIGPLKKVQEKAGDYGEGVLRFLMFSAGEEESIDSHPFHVARRRDVDDNDNNNNNNDDVTDEDNVEERERLSASGDDSTSSSDSSSTSSSEESSEEDEPVVHERVRRSHSLQPKTAAEALNDNSHRLGMGDFVFYSVLVGTAASSGSIFATAAAALGVIDGLIITLLVLSNNETVPALPVSILLGTIFHFAALSIDDVISDYYHTAMDQYFLY